VSGEPRPPAPADDRLPPPVAGVFAAVCLGLVGFSLCYTAISLLQLPVWTYFPREQEFQWVGPAGAEPMRYYGQTAEALLAGLLLGAPAGGLARRGLTGRTARLLLAWTVTAAAVHIAGQVWLNWP